MTINVLFGDCLRMMLDERNTRLPQRKWTSLALAEELDVDPSLVRRWIRNDRVPALDSEHVHRITQTLALSHDECRRLEEAQIASLKAHERGETQRRVREPDVIQLLRRADPAIGDERILPAITSSPPFRILPRNGGVIRTQEKVLAAAIQLLGRALKLKPGSGETILLTFQGAHHIFESSPLNAQWQLMVRNAIQQGWNMCHLWRLERDAGRSVRLVETMLAYLGGIGLYEPRYVTRYGVMSPPYDLLVVPGVGTMTFFATKHAHQIDAAHFSPDPEVIDLLSDHFRLLCENSAILLKSYTYARDRVAYHEALTVTEEKPGGRFLVKDGLSTATWPGWLQDEGSDWLRRAYDDHIDRAPILAQARRRARAFQTNVKLHQFHEVCPKSAIVRLVTQGKYSPDERSFRADFAASLEERMAHLESVIHTLQTHDNFHMALIDDHEEPEIMGTYWAVHGDHTVLLETWRTNEHGRKIDVALVITEPTIAGAFLDYGNELWDKISPRNRDKEYVIWWLQQQMQTLQVLSRSQVGEARAVSKSS